MAEPVDYYIAAIVDAIEQLSDSGVREEGRITLTLKSIQLYYSVQVEREKIFFLEDKEMLSSAISILQTRKLIEWWPDEFGDDLVHIQEPQKLYDSLENNEPFNRLYMLKDNGKEWLARALLKINKSFSQNTEKLETKNIDEWQPLPIDRNSPEFEKSIEAAEEALKEIEGNNGYASTEPDERNAMVHTIRGTINALKDGTPSLEQIKVGLLKPLQYLSKKFTDSAIGAAAKAAVVELIKWLF